MTFKLLRVVVEINDPTLRLLILRPYWDSNLESSDSRQTPYPLGHRAEGKGGKTMVKIPINVLSSYQKAVFFTILPGL